ncbi:hypothetical protein NEMIN01_0925 [Nematocida minor]|uniref:uncharacterized protein n=1 Tax=Nematocida minor TaxID=1912983 RepID=UPI0022209A6F|nr:uncharacterized protein NEMIN01_0925 [Nematocida minor]KAI5190226.1 hypothetical protein NEMIN01_0925 [Nematocida minor]
MALKVLFVSRTGREVWTARYRKETNCWIVNNETVGVLSSTEILFQGRPYFISLSTPSDAYLYEIEELSEILQRCPKKPFEDLCKEIKAKQPRAAKKSRYYQQILRSSNCFMKTRTLDMFRRKQTRWEVNAEEFSNFKKVKLSVQNIIVTVEEEKETIGLFYEEENQKE